MGSSGSLFWPLGAKDNVGVVIDFSLFPKTR
jgi:hypothetical protein